MNTTLKIRLTFAAATALGLATTACGGASLIEPHAGTAASRAKDLGGATVVDRSAAGAMTCGAGSCSGHDAGVSVIPTPQSH